MALTSQQRQDLKNRFIKGIKNAVAGDPGNTLGGQPVEDFLAGPAPSNPFSRFQWDSGRRVCRRWAAGRSPSILPGRDIYWRNLCEQYIEDEFGPLGDATSAPPFEGGQCSVIYEVWAEEWNPIANSFNASAPQGGSLETITGPVTGLRLGVGSECFTGFTTGRQLTILGQGAGDTSERTIVPTRCVANTNTGGVGLRALRLVRRDGLDDNCGSLPDDFDPGTGPTIPPESGPIPSPPGWEIPDFDIDITLNPDGTIDIDFGDGEPDITIDPGAPELPPVNPGPPPGDQGEPGTGAEAGSEDAEGEAPDGSVLVGVRLQLIEAPSNAKKFAPVVYRGAAYIYMGGDVGLDQDFAGSMLVADQFIYAEKDNLTRWKVISNQGFRWNVTPYYREIEQ